MFLVGVDPAPPEWERVDDPTAVGGGGVIFLSRTTLCNEQELLYGSYRSASFVRRPARLG